MPQPGDAVTPGVLRLSVEVCLTGLPAGEQVNSTS